MMVILVILNIICLLMVVWGEPECKRIGNETKETVGFMGAVGWIITSPFVIYYFGKIICNI